MTLVRIGAPYDLKFKTVDNNVKSLKDWRSAVKRRRNKMKNQGANSIVEATTNARVSADPTSIWRVVFLQIRSVSALNCLLDCQIKTSLFQCELSHYQINYFKFGQHIYLIK